MLVNFLAGVNLKTAMWIISIPFIIETVRAKNTLIKSFVFLHNLTLKVVECLER